MSVRDQDRDTIPDLVVTNSSGEVVLLPGIGSNGDRMSRAFWGR